MSRQGIRPYRTARCPRHHTGSAGPSYLTLTSSKITVPEFTTMLPAMTVSLPVEFSEFREFRGGIQGTQY